MDPIRVASILYHVATHDPSKVRKVSRTEAVWELLLSLAFPIGALYLAAHWLLGSR